MPRGTDPEVVAVTVAVKIEVLEAAIRLLGPGYEYPGLKLAGDEESARKFTEDVLMVAEAIAAMVEGTVQ